MIPILVGIAYLVVGVFAFRYTIRLWAEEYPPLEAGDVLVAIFAALYWPVSWPIFATDVPRSRSNDKFPRLKRWAGVK